MAGVSDLFDLCAEWLACCEDAAGSTFGGTIDLAYVAEGAPAFDCCPFLTVHAGGPAEAETAPLSPPLAPGHRPTATGNVHLVNITATVIRCSAMSDDDGNPPDASAIEIVARQTMEDVWAIWNFTLTRKREGTLFASPSGSRELILDAAVPIVAQGGCTGWSIPIRVALGGYAPGVVQSPLQIPSPTATA